MSQPSIVAKRLARHFALGRSRVLIPLPPDVVWVFSHIVAQGCDSRINAKAIRMRKVVKCERFARISILELHFRLRTPKSANGTLRVVHYHSQVIACGVQVQF
jgi:hypothetical protein